MQVIVLGSTGSIGTQTLDVCEHLNCDVVGLSCHGQIDLLEEQARRFRPRWLAVADPDKAAQLEARFKSSSYQPEILTGDAGVTELAAKPCDTVIVSILGFAALRPLLAAVEAERRIGLANKEAVVCFGHWLLPRVAELGVELIPVDSEHSAIWQGQRVSPDAHIRKIYLTASGGPFRTYPAKDLADVTPAMALDHPVWAMGAKITIDSATLMNKGLELIEAYRLFGVPADDIDVVVHPEGLIHSMLAYDDGSVMAQLSVPDMRLPIQLALTWPERVPGLLALPDLFSERFCQLTFEKPREDVFPALRLARRALAMGDLGPTAYNAANEVAVAAFLDGRLDFPGISEIVEAVLERLAEPDRADLLSVPQELDFAPHFRAMMNLDSWSRTTAEGLIRDRER